MSDENLWGDDTFNDMPDEAKLDENGRPQQAPPVRLTRPVAPPVVTQPSKPEPAYEEPVEEELSEEEEDASEVLADASLRLEQGNLYKMIIGHNFFEGIDSDPKAVQNVQREIRKFAKERMEVMLGMRRETAVVEQLEIDFPFNQKEVEVLKAVCRTATKGDSENSDRYVPEVTRTTQEIPLVGNRTGLNPIRSAPKKAAPVKTPARTETRKPLPSKPTAPVKRTKLDLTIDEIARQEGVPRELLEENVAGLGGKPLHELSETEILERNRLISQRRGAQVKSSQAIPMATYEQHAQIALERSTTASGSPLMAQILDAVKKMPIKNED